MRFKCCLTALHVSVLVALLLTLEAECEDSDCEIEILVRRNTVYKVLTGENFSINCTVVFCNNSPPTVSWYKHENGHLFNISRGHSKWTRSSGSEGILHLFFQGILESDSGEYQCKGGESMSHLIYVTVYGEKQEHTSATPNTVTDKREHTNATPNTVTESQTVQDVFWPYVYRFVGVMAFAIIVIAIYYISKYVHGGVCCKRRCQDTADLSSHRASSVVHIYENEQ